MRNKVEILRAIEFTVEDLQSITNLDEIDEFTDKDKEFIEEFKKIYEFGLNQLEFFINKLDQEGKDLDEYSIQYYVNVLLNGPLGEFVRTLSKGKKYFVETPDSMGIVGNKLRSSQNVTVLEGYEVPLGCSVDVYNKLPLFIQNTLTLSINKTEEIFRSTLKSFVEYDNTLPIVDKLPQQRYSEEPTGQWVTKPSGSYMLKDSLFYRTIDNISSNLYQLILDYLGEENFRLFTNNKQYNPFDDTNDSTSKPYIIKEILTQNNKSQEVEIDISGNIIDSIEKRNSSIQINTETDVKEYNLSTNEGLLGN